MRETTWDWSTVALAAALSFAPGASGARQQGTTSAPDFQPPCRGVVWWTESDATFEDFDFWVGEWQVYDRETGRLMGFDRIEKIFEGCALRQHWRQMNDAFSTPGAPWRLEGGSHTALGADGRWHQTWLDNSGSNLPLAGGLNADGVMVVETAWLEFTNRHGRKNRRRYRWHWDPQPDGTIHNWGFVMSGETWTRYFNIVYRSNRPRGPSAHLESRED